MMENTEYAFPNPYYGNHNGMSLRDWLAGQAMIGICLNTKDEVSLEEIPIAKAIAIQAYRLADAMIKERSK